MKSYGLYFWCLPSLAGTKRLRFIRMTVRIRNLFIFTAGIFLILKSTIGSSAHSLIDKLSLVSAYYE